MKLLVIICSHAFQLNMCDNIKILKDYLQELNIQVEYCGISNQDDFSNFESIITFRYKIINTKYQFSKICDFISDYKSELDHDWYMKIRPDIKLLENINFDILSKDAVNARARAYRGPKKIKYGLSINGEGPWKNSGDCHYDEIESYVILCDMLFIFHKNIIDKGGFDKINEINRLCEYTQSAIWNSRKIPLNVIGLYLENTKYNAFSGDMNI